MLAFDKKNELYAELMLAEINATRLQVSKTTKKQTKSDLGQFFTDPRLALFMSKLFEIDEPHVKLLDPGAGIGVLTTATITQLCKKGKKPGSIQVTAVEIDSKLINHLKHALEFCKQLCSFNNIQFSYSIVQEDFIDYGVNQLLKSTDEIINKVIMNPPYKKINSKSSERLTLRRIGIETTNLYAGFVAIAKKMLADGGELVAITPRSFCNGTYFRPFREDFLNDMSFRNIHLFDSRKDAFKDDEVLQENIIFHAVKGKKLEQVTISSSTGLEAEIVSHKLQYNELVHPNDMDKFIRILKNDDDIKIKKLMGKITTSLNDLGLSVSTGKVVDFRTLENLRDQPEDGAVPLIYPVHFNNGYLRWPVSPAEKPNAIKVNESTEKQLLCQGNYVLVKRFSPKEEKRRIVPAIYDSSNFETEFIGFENHTNYYHHNGHGIPLVLAKGLALYLSSTIVDLFFRQFNGHTQVNVGDLKSLPYPTYEQLVKLGASMREEFPSQEIIDRLVSSIINISV